MAEDSLKSLTYLRAKRRGIAARDSDFVCGSSGMRWPSASTSSDVGDARKLNTSAA